MIQSVQRATRILSVLAEHYGEPITLTCLARRAQLNSATCAHIVATLEAEGYVIKLSRTRGYVLGPEAYCLSRLGRYKNDLITQCHPVMEYLHKMTGYTVILAVIDGETKYIIDYIDNGEIFETKAQIRQDDIYRTATVPTENKKEQGVFQPCSYRSVFSLPIGLSQYSSTNTASSTSK